MKLKHILKGLRFSMSFIFLWAFIDKTLGLGFSTVSENAWINGVSPTSGFLTNGTYGTFAEFFQSLAGNVVIDWVFMLGLLAIGLSLLLNKYVKWGVIGGILMMLLMYLAAFPPKNNPFVDSHIIYIFVFALLAFEKRILSK
jgi:thiosulfate dehydrogenase [quinone] large subunit